MTTSQDNDDPTIPDIKVSTYNEDKVAPYTSQTERGAVHNMADILNFMFRTDKDTDLVIIVTLYYCNFVTLSIIVTLKLGILFILENFILMHHIFITLAYIII